jgi:hypothetical protein
MNKIVEFWKKNPLWHLRKIKIIGLTLPVSLDEVGNNGELHTHAAFFMMRDTILELNARVDELEYRIALMNGEVEPENES